MLAALQTGQWSFRIIGVVYFSDKPPLSHNIQSGDTKREKSKIKRECTPNDQLACFPSDV